MKLPKAINLCGQTWKIVRSKGGGGFFSCDTHEIEVGLDGDDQRQWEIFIHEITEAIMTDNLMRYQKPYSDPSNGDYLFCFTHNDFEVMFVKPLASALWELIP